MKNRLYSYAFQPCILVSGFGQKKEPTVHALKKFFTSGGDVDGAIDLLECWLEEYFKF